MKNFILKNFLFFILLSVLTTSCYVYKCDVGAGAKGNISREMQWNHYLFGGLIPVAMADFQEMAGSVNDYSITVKHSFLNIIVSVITIGIYTPTTTIVKTGSDFSEPNKKYNSTPVNTYSNQNINTTVSNEQSNFKKVENPVINIGDKIEFVHEGRTIEGEVLSISNNIVNVSYKSIYGIYSEKQLNPEYCILKEKKVTQNNIISDASTNTTNMKSENSGFNIGDIVEFNQTGKILEGEILSVSSHILKIKYNTDGYSLEKHISPENCKLKKRNSNVLQLSAPSHQNNGNNMSNLSISELYEMRKKAFADSDYKKADLIVFEIVKRKYGNLSDDEIIKQIGFALQNQDLLKSNELNYEQKRRKK